MSRTEQILSKFRGVQEAGTGWTALCPAHDDQNPSLSISERDDGRILLHCHTGCAFKAVVAAAGLDPKDLRPMDGNRKSPRRRIVAEYWYHDEKGNGLFQVVRYEPKQFRQRRRVGDKWEWKVKGVRVVPYRLPVLLSRPSEIVLIVEGEKDTDAAIELGFVATCNAGGAGKWTDEHSKFLTGRDAVIVPDNDEAGRNHTNVAGKSLQGVSASLRVLNLPGLREKGDLSDWLAAGGNRQQLLELLATATQPWSEASGGNDPTADLPQVELSTNEAAVADEVIGHLSQLGLTNFNYQDRLFQRNGLLVEILPVECPDAVNSTYRMRRLPMPTLRERISKACQFITITETKGGEEIGVKPCPRWLLEAIFNRGYYAGDISPLTGIIQSPTIRRDGSILQTNGYDNRSGLVYHPIESYDEVPDIPSLAQAQAAADSLLRVVQDFPFATPSDQSAWLALLLTAIGRPCIAGCTPMFPVTASTPGTGKGLLVDVTHLIAYGTTATTTPFSDDNEETRKLITSVALDGSKVVVFDNVNTVLGGSALDHAITTTSWSDRVLGRSEQTGALDLRPVWIATGNNIHYSTDMGRRVVPIRLESLLEFPEERTDFQEPDLVGYVRKHRARFAIDALTILRAYFAAGCPKQKVTPMGKFEQFVDIVCGAIVWIGLPDPLATREGVKEQDTTKESLAALIAGFEELKSKSELDKDGWTSGEIEKLVTTQASENPILTEAIGLVCGNRLTLRAIGNGIKKYVGRTHKYTRIVGSNAGSNLKKWTIEKVPRVSQVSQLIPDPHGKDKSTTSESAIGTAGKLTNSTNRLTLTCAGCGLAVEPGETVDGWRRWECPGCHEFARRDERIQPATSLASA